MTSLTLAMLTFVLLISFVVINYAQRYMASDPKKNTFLMKLCGVTLSVLCLVLANNLVVAFIGWQGISYFIYQLLTHYQNRPQAIAAAKHKRKITGIGDMSFLIAIFLAYATVHSSQYNLLAQSSQAGWIAFCLMLAVMTKASLLPFHTWLPNTLETPTPVSALMHAGVVNAGGFLLIRVFPLMHQHMPLLIFLTLIGGLTALIGSLYTLIQPSIKKKLAYSTVSQMGFMFFQYGLGSPASALFHLFSHGLYKATAFLDSGNGLKSTRTIESPYSFAQALKNTILALLETAIILIIADHYLDLQPIPLFTTGFVSISLFQWLLTSLKGSWRQQILTFLIALLLIAEYAWTLHTFEALFSLTNKIWLPAYGQYLILTGVWAIQIITSLSPMQSIQKTPIAHALYKILKEHRYA